MKMNEMEHDMQIAPSLDFISRVFVHKNDEQLLKEAPTFVINELYKFDAK